MSTPVNPALSFQTRPSYLTAEELKSNTIQDYASPFLRPEPYILDAIRVLQPAAPTGTTESVKLHDKAGNEIGTVSYNPEDPHSLLQAYNQLSESEWPLDQQEAFKIGLILKQKTEAEIAKLSLLHQIAMSAINATKQA